MKRKSTKESLPKLDFVKRPKIALGSDILFEEETVEPSSSTAVIRGRGINLTREKI
jgi:hypothetical protein